MDVYFYSRSNLPKNGWLQGCLVCRMVTGNYYLENVLKVRNRTYNINTYLCNNCDKETHDSEKFLEEFEKIYQRRLRHWAFLNQIKLK